MLARTLEVAQEPLQLLVVEPSGVQQSLREATALACDRLAEVVKLRCREDALPLRRRAKLRARKRTERSQIGRRRHAVEERLHRHVDLRREHPFEEDANLSRIQDAAIQEKLWEKQIIAHPVLHSSGCA